MRFARETSGATAIEYAILAAGIALVIVTAVHQIGTEVSGMFSQVSAGF